MVRVSAAEYRQDGGRERYMVRPLDVNTFDPLPGAAWRDYLGEDIYGDYAVDQDTGEVTLGTQYLAGIGFRDPIVGEPRYLHDDQIGSLRALSSAAPQPAVTGRKVYTAFGEQVHESGAIGTRYQYAGAWGYAQAECREIPDGQGGFTTWCDPLAELGWLHVGARYYDPSTGRFLQRDPLGIEDALNVYAYTANLPTIYVDPDGEWMRLIQLAEKGWNKVAPHVARGGKWVWGGTKRGGQWVWGETKQAGQWVKNTCASVKRNVRIEKHQLPGYRNYKGGVWHINIRKAHIIIDPRVIKDKIRTWW